MRRCKGGTGRKGDWHKGGERKPASAKGGCGPLSMLQGGDKKNRRDGVLCSPSRLLHRDYRPISPERCRANTA